MSVGAILVMIQTWLQLRLKFRTINDLRATELKTIGSQEEIFVNSTISSGTYGKTLEELQKKVWKLFSRIDCVSKCKLIIS